MRFLVTAARLPAWACAAELRAAAAFLEVQLAGGQPPKALTHIAIQVMCYVAEQLGDES